MRTAHGKRGLWTVLPLDGVLRITATAPPPPGTTLGRIYSDGSLRTKFPWWGSRSAAEKLTITGKRLDAPAARLRLTVGPGATARSPHFWATRPRFSSPGCWRVTGTSGRARLTFTISVQSVSQPFPDAPHSQRFFATEGQTIARLRDVDGRPGVEIFVHEAHSTTEELTGVYAFDGRALRRAAAFAFDGEEAGIVSGFTCHRHPPATIVAHEFAERIPFRGVWDRINTAYRWVGGSLRRSATHKVRARPSRREVGVHC